jgi:protoporphyrinogen oxidase
MDYDVIVVGSGISGMSFAHYASRAGMKTLVIEKDESPGGCVHSQRLENGFWFELGAHTCYNSYRTLIGILEERQLLSKLLRRERVPFRLLVKDRVRPIAKELSIFELLLSVPRIVTTSKAGNSVRGYYGRIVGRGNYDRVFGPLFAAVPSQKADGFPADMLFKRRERRKDVLRSFTLAGGLQTIIDSIAADPTIEFQPGAEVTAMEKCGKTIRLNLAKGGTCSARRVALAVPAPSAAALVAQSFPEAAGPISRIKASPIHSFGVVVRKDATPLEPVAGIIPLDNRFFSMVSRDTVQDPAWRGFAFHFPSGVSKDDALGQACAVLKVDRRAIEHVFERVVVLSSPALGHNEIVKSIDSRIAGTPVFITGNYFGGLAIEDCVIRSKQEAARLLKSF